MELLIIGEGKLKIMLNKWDMKLYGLNESDFQSQGKNTREIINRIIEDSPKSLGLETFDTESYLKVMLYPCKDGGCEMFVTRLKKNNFDFEEGYTVAEQNEEKALIQKVNLKPVPQKRHALTYSFKNLEDTIKACKELTSRGVSWESALYLDTRHRYYLYLKQASDEKEKSPPPSFLSEFGELESTDKAMLTLSERGRAIFSSGAIQNLSQL